MANKDAEEKIKAFGMSNQMLAEELSTLEKKFGVQLGHLLPLSEIVERDYYPQLDAATREEAAQMARHYEVFYSLEKSIRALVDDTLASSEKTSEWWTTQRVPQNIQHEVSGRIQKELDAGVTRRSLEELDYTTFGELSVIIVSNWSLFGGIFNSKKALEKVFSSLNALRNPIAHCCPLAEDEQLRLRLAVRDWFRLMEK